MEKRKLKRAEILLKVPPTLEYTGKGQIGILPLGSELDLVTIVPNVRLHLNNLL